MDLAVIDLDGADGQAIRVAEHREGTHPFDDVLKGHRGSHDLVHADESHAPEIALQVNGLGLGAPRGAMS